MSALDMTEAVANLAWWQEVLLLLSHLPALPLIRLAWRLRLYFFGTVVMVGLVASVVYHMCLTWDMACFGLPLEASHLDDYIWASYFIVAAWLVILRVYAHAWASIVSLSALALIIFASLAAPFSLSVQLFIIVLAVLLLFLKAILIDTVWAGPRERIESAIDVAYRYCAEPLVYGLIALSVALVAYFADGPRWYWFTHSVWHFVGYIGVYLVILGVTRDLEQWPGWRHERAYTGGKRSESDAAASSLMPPALAPLDGGHNHYNQQANMRPRAGAALLFGGSANAV